MLIRYLRSQFTRPAPRAPIGGVLGGCASPAIAYERARDLMPAAFTDALAPWLPAAQHVLAAYLHAAALTGRTPDDVARWVFQLPRNTDGQPVEQGDREVYRILEGAGSLALLAAFASFTEANQRSASTVRAVIAPVVAPWGER